MKREDALWESYKLIHESVQECHKHAWGMTGILVPVIGAGLGLFHKMSSSGELIALWGFGLGIILICLFWYRVMAYLRRCNLVRIQRLRELEVEIDNALGMNGENACVDYYRRMRRVRHGDEKQAGKRFFVSVKGMQIGVVLIVSGTLIAETLRTMMG